MFMTLVMLKGIWSGGMILAQTNFIGSKKGTRSLVKSAHIIKNK